MKKILRFIKHVCFSLLFIAILCGLLIESSYLFRFNEDATSSVALTGFYAEDKNTIDVVNIGSSSTYRFFVAPVLWREIGVTSYNYATAQMPFEAIETLLDEVENTQNPKLFVIELRNYIKRTNSVMSGFKETEEYLKEKESYVSRLINNMPVTLERFKLIHTLVPDLKQNELEWQFEYLRTHNNWKNLKAQDVKDWFYTRTHQDEINAQNKNEFKGATTITAVDYNETPQVSDWSKKTEITGERLEILDSLVEHIKEKGYNVLFVSTPYPVDENLYSYENWLKDYFAEKDMDYLNCNDRYDEVGVDFASDFYDEKHTNTYGAYKFTSYFAKYIKDKYNLSESAVSEKVKKEWDTASDFWWSEIGEPGIEHITSYVEKQKSRGNTNY